MNPDRNQSARRPPEVEQPPAIEQRTSSKPNKLKGAGLGVELAATLIGFAILGIWIDHEFAAAPWGTVICLGVGLVGGFYNFIRSSMKVLEAPRFRGSRKEEDG